MSPFTSDMKKESTHLQPDRNSATALGRSIFFGIFLAVGMMTVSSPVFAQSTPVPGAGFGHFNSGIPVFWPYHVLLISVGFILLTAGFVTARYRKTGNWYKTHMILEAGGSACIIAGLFIGVYMVTLSGVPHLRNIHEITGVVTLSLIIITVIIGYFIRRVTKSKNTIRTGHRWLGRLSIALVIINILLGLLVLSLVLGR
jgi:Eukaryotic cytochrome b561